MSTMMKLPDNDPRVVAWNSYKSSEAYINSFKWAEHEQHRTGSMWSAFIAGFDAHLAKFTPDWAGYRQGPEDGKAEALAQPAQAVDVGEPIAWAWHSDSMKGWALGHVKPTPENTERFHERNTIVRGLYFDPSALSGEKSGRVDGIAMASAYIQKKADDYAAENCGTEWDTGATTYRYGQAGEDYHHTLLELAEELAALPASPAPDKEGL